MRLFSSAATLLFALPALAAPVFTYTSSFSPIKCSYTEMSRILGGVETYLAQSNGNAARPIVRITATRGQQSIAASNVHEFQTAAELLPVAYEVEYSYSCDECSAITSVRLDLSDYSRKLSVEGPSHEHVEALFAMLSRNLESQQQYLGGSMVRLVAGSVFIMCGLLIISVGVSESRTRLWQAVFGIGGALIVFAVISISWDTILPGTSIYANDPSLIIRYSAEISLVGAILTVATFAISIWYSRLSETKRARIRAGEQSGIADDDSDSEA